MKYINLGEACKRLSTDKSDLLNSALDGKLKLSVKFLRPEQALAGKIIEPESGPEQFPIMETIERKNFVAMSVFPGDLTPAEDACYERYLNEQEAVLMEAQKRMTEEESKAQAKAQMYAEAKGWKMADFPPKRVL